MHGGRNRIGTHQGYSDGLTGLFFVFYILQDEQCVRGCGFGRYQGLEIGILFCSTSAFSDSRPPTHTLLLCAG